MAEIKEKERDKKKNKNKKQNLRTETLKGFRIQVIAYSNTFLL